MKDPDYAKEFAAQLAGKDAADFNVIQGDLLFRPGEGMGTMQDAVALDAIDLDAFYDSETDDDRLAQVEGFLQSPRDCSALGPEPVSLPCVGVLPTYGQPYKHDHARGPAGCQPG